MDVSICIVNYMTTDLLLRCLDSIACAPPTADFETIVIDNASPSFDPGTIAKRVAGTRVVQNLSNLGYAAACNQAIALARGGLILLCNPDIELTPGALDALVAFLGEHPRAAGAAPQLVYPSGKIQASCRGFPTPSGLFFEITGLARLFPGSRRIAPYRMRYFGHNQTMQVEQPMASCLMLRRAAIDEVGLLDEQFPIFCNDVDWAMRAADRGWGMYFVAQASAIHHLGQSTKHMGLERIRETTRSMLRLYRKHYENAIPGLVYYPTIGLIWAAGSLRSAVAGFCGLFRRKQ
jgi:GT2 family glycosyltransferase